MMNNQTQLAELSELPGCTTYQARDQIRRTIIYFKDKINKNEKILDIGQKSILTNELKKNFNVKIDNTTMDLDCDFNVPGKNYDLIIYSHTIEHQFSPLNTLLKIRDILKVSGRLYIILPDRGKLLWCKGHYHEIDKYRMELLLKRAGFKIISLVRLKAWRHWTEYLTGFRPLLRLVKEYDAFYEVGKL